jgi:hypothetical protein
MCLGLTTSSVMSGVSSTSDRISHQNLDVFQKVLAPASISP